MIAAESQFVISLHAFRHKFIVWQVERPADPFGCEDLAAQGQVDHLDGRVYYSIYYCFRLSFRAFVQRTTAASKVRGAEIMSVRRMELMIVCMQWLGYP